MAMEIEEIIKLVIVVVVLVVLVGAFIFLFSGKGGEVLAAIKNFMKFGG